MPKGPRGEKRLADVNGNAVTIMRIATGEIQDNSRELGKEYARKIGIVDEWEATQRTERTAND